MKDGLREVSFPLRRASIFGFLTKTESRGLWIQAPFLTKVNSLCDILGKPLKEYVVSQPLSEFQDSKESGLPTDDFLLNVGRVLLSNHVHEVTKNLGFIYLVNYKRKRPLKTLRCTALRSSFIVLIFSFSFISSRILLHSLCSVALQLPLQSSHL